MTVDKYKSTEAYQTMYHPTKPCVKCGEHYFNIYKKGVRNPTFTKVCVSCNKKQPA